MIDLRCSLDVRESGARLGFIYGSTMGVDELLVKLKCRIPAVRNRFDRFARGLLFTGRPLFLCRGNQKLLHRQLGHLFTSNGCSSIPTARTCCSTNDEVDGLS